MVLDRELAIEGVNGLVAGTYDLVRDDPDRRMVFGIEVGELFEVVIPHIDAGIDGIRVDAYIEGRLGGQFRVEFDPTGEPGQRAAHIETKVPDLELDVRPDIHRLVLRIGQLSECGEEEHKCFFHGMDVYWFMDVAGPPVASVNGVSVIASE